MVHGRDVWKKGHGVRVVVYGEARATEGGAPFFTINL